MLQRIRRLMSFGEYNAAIPTQRRKNISSTIRTADEILTPSKRNRLIETARDLQRNFAVVGWMVRKHLDYVSRFSFQAETHDEVFNERLEELVEWWSRPINFDVAARHGRHRFLRLLETRRVLDGDVFTVKMRDGHIQAIESDRVKNPPNPNADQNWIHGIKIAPGGALKAIAVHKRTRNGYYEFEREVSAANAIQLGYFEGFDQYRGVSPLTSALESFQDIMEMSDLARAKAKVHSLFALAITKEMSDLLEDEEQAEEDEGYNVDFGKGPLKLELDQGDKAEFLESKHPSTEFQAFMDVTLQIALKALDIPTSMYREDMTNYYGSRQAQLLYVISVQQKRLELVEFLNRILTWRISMWVANGVLTLPAGYALGDLKWDWIPAATPWFSPDKDLAGDIICIENGLRTRSDIVRERFGQDWKQVVRRLRAEDEFMRANNIEPKTPSIPVDDRDTVPGYQDDAEPVE